MAIVTPVRGPYFEELEVGQVYNSAVVTLTSGMQATHHAIVGSRLRLQLDHGLAEAVTGAVIAAPAMVWDVSIGQSTAVTQFVMANLFYRGLSFRRYPSLGDSLSTETTVVALKENARRPGRANSGLAALRIVTSDQQGRPVLDYLRCAMLPLSPGAEPTDAADDIAAIGAPVPPEESGQPFKGWRLELFRSASQGLHFADLAVGMVWEVVGADLVSSGPELARLTGNLAAVHHDAAAAGGTRLVYGGHTIGLALHQVTRALPNLVTVVGWRHCHHVGPVREGDLLTSTIEVESIEALPGGGGLVELDVTVAARDNSAAEPRIVLDWRFTALMA